MEGIFQYRDCDNYKFRFTATIPKGVILDDEIDYMDLGYDRESFHKDIIGYDYDETSDHTTVTLIELLPE